MNWKSVQKLSRRHPRILVGGVILLIVATAGIGAPLFAPNDPVIQHLELSYKTAMTGFPLGADEFGRCILSRLLYGARISLTVGFIAVGIGATIGGLLGLVAAMKEGIVDTLIMRAMDAMLAIPGILLAVTIVAALGPGMLNVMLAVGISSIPGYARLVRGSVLSVREREFVEAARALGAPVTRVARVHIVPNILAPVLVVATMQMGSAILSAAGLSFVGLGAQAPTPEWGSMLSRGRESLRIAPHIATYPGLAIFITVMGFNFFGDGIRDYLDPRLKA